MHDAASARTLLDGLMQQFCFYIVIVKSTVGAMSLAFNEEKPEEEGEEGEEKKNPNIRYNSQEENYDKRLLSMALICHNEE